jgi:hypothetical protein
MFLSKEDVIGIGGKSASLTLLMLVWPIVFLFPQTVPVSESPAVFAPFVSRLTAEVRNNLVRLSWLDSPVVRGPVAIYCADNPINTDAIDQSRSQIRPIEVPYGVQFYVDETYSKTRYYYVVAADEAGTKYYLPLPTNNMLSVDVQEEAARPANTQGSALQLSSVGDSAFSLEAVVRGEGVVLSFKTVGGGRNLVLYRSSQPLRQKDDLLKAVIVQSDIASPFVDYPVPGIAYYYALIPQNEIVRGTVGLTPGHNATIAPVRVPVSQYGMIETDSPDMRSLPLPLMLITNLVPWNGSAGNFPATELSPRATQALADIKKAAVSPAKKPRAFKEDMETPASGEQDVLRSTVQGPFVKRDWQAVKDQLGRFLSLPRNNDAVARAHFYLGQAYYFSNQPRQSLFEFLMIKPLYPQEAKEWIDASLGLIIDKGEKPR